MKANARSTASAWGIKRYIYPCEVSTKIAYVGSKLLLSMCKLHKKVQHFFSYGTKSILLILSKNISKIRYSKSCILYHIANTTIEALLYQPLRFILTFKSNRSMVSFGRKHCKYDMHIYFHASFLGHIALCYPEFCLQIVSEYDQDIPQSHTADNPVAPYKTSVISWPCHILYSENQHHLHKH